MFIARVIISFQVKKKKIASVTQLSQIPNSYSQKRIPNHYVITINRKLFQSRLDLFESYVNICGDDQQFQNAPENSRIAPDRPLDGDTHTLQIVVVSGVRLTAGGPETRLEVNKGHYSPGAGAH